VRGKRHQTRQISSPVEGWSRCSGHRCRTPFKTPWTGNITIIEGDKILVLDEATPQKLIDRKAERPRARLQAREAELVQIPHKSELSESQ
jgi:hypothetical protein